MIIPTKSEKLGILLMNVCRQRGKTANQFMEQSNLYRGQGLMLLFIADHDGQTHSEIAERLNISPAAATKAIKRLEKEGYLQRQSDENDERISRVFLRKEGRAIIEEIYTSFKRLDKKTFEGFSDEDLDKFHEYLTRILNNLQNN